MAIKEGISIASKIAAGKTGAGVGKCGRILSTPTASMIGSCRMALTDLICTDTLLPGRSRLHNQESGH
jgi:hypothetical protein